MSNCYTDLNADSKSLGYDMSNLVDCSEKQLTRNLMILFFQFYPERFPRHVRMSIGDDVIFIKAICHDAKKRP